MFILILHLEAQQPALPYLLSRKTIRENQEDSDSFLQHECLLQTLDTFIGERGRQILDSLLTAPHTTFSTLQALYKSFPHFPPIKIKPFNCISL